jgi:hypothetical protein
MDDAKKKVPPGRPRKTWPHVLFDEWLNRKNLKRAAMQWEEYVKSGIDPEVLNEAARSVLSRSPSVPQLAAVLNQVVRMLSVAMKKYPLVAS